jgi:hypothetical protein
VPGEAKKRTIRLVDFLQPGNNTFTVTRQPKVKGARDVARIADLVVFVNGIPLVVIEAKKPDARGEERAGLRADPAVRSADPAALLQQALQRRHQPGFGGNGGPDGTDPLEQVALQIDGIYGSDATAPAGWHLKEQLRKELRQQVRTALHPTGLTG